MRKILVPTDFSKNADHALQYAINIANHFESEIHLLNVYEVSNNTTGSFSSVEEYIRENAERQLSKTISSVKNAILRKTILKGRAIKGNPIYSICGIANIEKFDLIVMGTQGASGLKEIFLGSKTAGVMKKTTVPLLVIPNEFKYRPIKEIVFPVDSGIVADSFILTPLLQLVKAYKSKVKVLHLKTEKVLVGYDPGIEYFLEGIPHSFHTIAGSNDVNGVINLFVFEHDADMICLIRRDRGFFEKIFHRSVTSKEVFHCRMPLLILHEAVST